MLVVWCVCRLVLSAVRCSVLPADCCLLLDVVCGCLRLLVVVVWCVVLSAVK